VFIGTVTKKHQGRTLFEPVDPSGEELVMRSVGTWPVRQDNVLVECEIYPVKELLSWHIVIQKIPNFW
jgi:hypothetical protein